MTTEHKNNNRQPRVLIVDDEEDLALLAVQWYQMFGFQTYYAFNSDDAVAKLAELDGDIDMLFTDIVMPGKMDGIELGEFAKNINSKIYVVLTTGYADRLIRKNTLPGPVIDKPYRRKDLEAAIDAGFPNILST